MNASLIPPAAVQALQPDTVVMVPVRDGFDYLQGGTLVLILTGLVVLIVLLVRVVFVLGRLRRSIDPLVQRANEGLQPMLDHARSVSENVDYVSHAVRQDVAGLAEAVERIRRRLDQASDHMEERIDDFNALMEVVQSEAEEIFIDTASTVRGVRAGSASLAGDRDEDDGDGRGPARDRRRERPRDRRSGPERDRRHGPERDRRSGDRPSGRPPSVSRSPGGGSGVNRGAGDLSGAEPIRPADEGEEGETGNE